MWLSLIPQLHSPGELAELSMRHHHFLEESAQYYDGKCKCVYLYSAQIYVLYYREKNYIYYCIYTAIQCIMLHITYTNKVPMAGISIVNNVK